MDFELNGSNNTLTLPMAVLSSEHLLYNSNIHLWWKILWMTTCIESGVWDVILEVQTALWAHTFWCADGSIIHRSFRHHWKQSHITVNGLE